MTQRYKDAATFLCRGSTYGYSLCSFIPGCRRAPGYPGNGLRSPETSLHFRGSSSCSSGRLRHFLLNFNVLRPDLSSTPMEQLHKTAQPGEVYLQFGQYLRQLAEEVQRPPGQGFREAARDDGLGDVYHLLARFLPDTGAGRLFRSST